MSLCVIVPIRHASSRVKGKNYRLMNGKPLYYWVIRTLLSIECIDKIVIDTNSLTIKTGLVYYFFSNKANKDKIEVYDRPEELCGNDVSTNTLLLNVINSLNLNYDYYLQTHVTNPLLSASTIEKTIDAFYKQNKYDTLFSVNEHFTRLYDKNGKDINHNRFKLVPTQDLDPIYEENSCIYIFTKKTLIENNARISKNAMMYVIPKLESQDIDWDEDFLLTEILMKHKDKLL